MHTNNMNKHDSTNHEIDAKVLALQAAIAQDQIKYQRNGTSNTGVNSHHHHVSPIPSDHFVQMMETSQQPCQQAPPYFTGQSDYHPPLNGQNTYHHPLQHQQLPQSHEEPHIPEDILASLINLEQLNQIIENGNEVMGMRDHVMPLIDQQTSAQLFGVRSDGRQDFATPSPITPSNSQSPAKASNHKRSVSAVTSYHPTLMEELEQMNSSTYLTPPGTPTNQLSNAVQGKLPLPRLQVSPKQQVLKAKEGGGRAGPLMYHPIAPHPNGSEVGVIRTIPQIVIPPKPRRKSSTVSTKDITVRQCANCGDLNTSQWRHGKEKQILCNPCGLYLRNHGMQRDVAKILAKKNDLSLTELCKRIKEVVLTSGGHIRLELEKELTKSDPIELISMIKTLNICLQIAQHCLDVKNKDSEKDFIY